MFRVSRFSLREAAKALGVSDRTLWQWTNEGRGPSFKSAAAPSTPSMDSGNGSRCRAPCARPPAFTAGFAPVAAAIHPKKPAKCEKCGAAVFNRRTIVDETQCQSK